MEQYLISYLKNHIDNPLAQKYVDFLKVELDWYIYNYGEHISTSHRRNKKLPLKVQIYRMLQYASAIYHKVNFCAESKNILSSIPSVDFVIALNNMGYNPISSILQPVGLKQIIGDKNTLKLIQYKNEAISNGTFNDLFNLKYFGEIDACCKMLITQYSQCNFEGLLLYTDQYFESKLLLSIFEKLNKPSFIFSHGLPGLYSLDVDNRSDYLLVWGEKIKQNYLDVGFKADKIFVVGNSKYNNIEKPKYLRNSLEDILVIPSSSIYEHQHRWNTPDLVDRSMIILYLYSVQNVLLQLGVKHARFRPHPSIDRNWVCNFIDNDFYKTDNEGLKASLFRSTLVVGATSTVFLEAIMNGVNYLVYEPQENEETLLRLPLVPPFDGSEKGVEIAKTEKDLLYMMKSGYQVDISVLDDYMQPLDISLLKNIIG